MSSEAGLSVCPVSTDPSDWTRAPGLGKYARPERERRFLVSGSVPAGAPARLIEDRYLDGLRLRLRRVTREGRSVHKLTQKVRTDERDPADVLITNMYLSEHEYALLLALPGHSLVKRRSVVQAASHPFVLDEFDGPLAGLRLAEVEVRDLAETLQLPGWLGHEVTHDDRFSGGRLAVADEAAVKEMLRGS